jgi:hypothetical protein
MDEWKKIGTAAARQKYTNKIIEVFGEVDSISEDPYDRVGYVYLKVEPTETGDRRTVRCGTSTRRRGIACRRAPR